LFVTRSPLKTHDRSRKDPQQKQLFVVRQAITAKDSRQRPQGCAAIAIVSCSSDDHRKRLTTEAGKDPLQKQLLVVRHAITAKDSRQKPQGSAVKAIIVTK